MFDNIQTTVKVWALMSTDLLVKMDKRRNSRKDAHNITKCLITRNNRKIENVKNHLATKNATAFAVPILHLKASINYY